MGVSHWAFLCGTYLLPPSALTKSLNDFDSEENKSIPKCCFHLCAEFISPAFLVSITTGSKHTAGNPHAWVLSLPPSLTSDL